MGKPKKGKRTGKDDEFDSEVDVEEQSQPDSVKAKSKAKDKKKKGEEVDDLIDDFEELKVDKSKGKKGKKGKRGDDDSDNESVSIASKSKGKNQDSDSETEMKSKAKNKKSKKISAAIEADSESDDDAPKAKGKAKKKKNKKTADSDDESEHEMTKVKGKNKKGKRGDADDEDDEEIPVKIETKSKKKGKKRDEVSEEDVPKPKGKTKKGRKESVSDEDSDIPIQASKNKAKPAKSGFALLDVEGDNDDDVDEAPPSDDESDKMESIERPKGKAQSQQKLEPQGKKGKKKKKKDDSDDEIEKALAELEIEYSGKKQEKTNEETTVGAVDPIKEEKSKKGKKEKSDKSDQRADSESKDDGHEGDEGSTVKTAAQKKKEKKERERLKKLAQKKAEGSKQADGEAIREESVEKVHEKKAESSERPDEAADGDDDGDDSKKKKKKGAKEDPKDKGKGPGKKMIAAMQEALKKLKEDEERAKQEEEERIIQEEAREKARLEQLQLEQERKEKKKLKEKQRKERLKAEGKLLTNKQKQDRARAQAMLEALKAQGMEIPEAGEKKPKAKLGTRIRPNKLKQQTSTEDKEEKKDERKPEQIEVEIVDEHLKVDEKKEGDVVKDTWDADSSEDEQEEDKSDEATKSDERKISHVDKKGEKITDKKESSDSESESGSETDLESDEESEEDSVDDKLTDAEKKREKAKLRIQSRRIEAEKKKNLDNLRAAVVCVLGHVDTGKTKILDKLRRTNVQDGEAGGITQQIGATNVPIEAIQDSTRHVKDFADKVFKIPGLLIIDTPGHESFSNLRNRGSSLCDIAVLVVDIMHGLEPQTIESIGLLKTKKCPFIVALNKIDRLYDWQTMNRKDIQDIIKAQGSNTQREFEKRTKDVILQFAEQGLNAAIFYENPDPRSYVSLVPTSAITGEGMGNLLALLVDACQGPLAKRLMYSEELQATVLEVKALPGLGTTIDCILVNGTLREGDTMIVAGTDGPIVTQIRSLLMPQPLKELRVKNAYKEHREVKAAQGVKIAAKDLEKAIAGLNLAVAQKPDEVEIMKEEIVKELSKALGNIKLAERGVFVQASTLGALEALLDFLKSSKIPNETANGEWNEENEDTSRIDYVIDVNGDLMAISKENIEPVIIASTNTQSPILKDLSTVQIISGINLEASDLILIPPSAASNSDCIIQKDVQITSEITDENNSNFQKTVTSSAAVVQVPSFLEPIPISSCLSVETDLPALESSAKQHQDILPLNYIDNNTNDPFIHKFSEPFQKLCYWPKCDLSKKKKRTNSSSQAPSVLSSSQWQDIQEAKENQKRLKAEELITKKKIKLEQQEIKKGEKEKERARKEEERLKKEQIRLEKEREKFVKQQQKIKDAEAKQKAQEELLQKKIRSMEIKKEIAELQREESEVQESNNQ